MILIIDNYDSFVFNLAQAFMELGKNVLVKRNDALKITEAAALKPEALVISPGPGAPLNAGISNDMIRFFSGKIPILGVCLGHQCLSFILGGKIKRSEKIMHGKLSRIHHDEKGLFEGIRNPFWAVRYHSLVVDETSLPSCLEISAFSDDGVIMGIRNKEKPDAGVQFHPESFLTDEGKNILSNFLQLGGKR
ncbi:MAG: aminodeoxychorismate/anthranilate synthase component II [Candidatus Aminicenantes bacterium]|nr:aminodeoxychorismate/anthranilate synthase component II [Candidatus Aminicenantes bacterium]